MDTFKATTGELLTERGRLFMEKRCARDCEDSDWAARCAHEIKLIETELNQRMGNPGGRA